MTSSITLCCLLGLFSLCFAQSAIGNNCKLPPCSLEASTCPGSSVCTNVANSNAGSVQAYACVCPLGYYSRCENGSITCLPNPNGGGNCGGDPTSSNFITHGGCPNGTECVLSNFVNSNGTQRTCICQGSNTVYDATLRVCRPICGPYQAYDEVSATCRCLTGYRNDPTSTSGCIPPPVATCTSLGASFCPQGYRCVNVNGNATCIPSPYARHCGVDFRCPNSTTNHYKCVDTTTGPTCVCDDGWAGADCSRPPCWRVNAILGCWWPNSQAECVFANNFQPEADSTATANSPAAVPFCRCLPGFTGINCTIPVPTCDDATTATCNQIPGARCVNNTCICLDGYVAADPTASLSVKGCTPVGPPTCWNTTCNGNTICAQSDPTNPDSTAKCICPTTFGDANCGRPQCKNNSDCWQGGVTNSYCVVNTNDAVPSYCICKPGYSGERCEISNPPCLCNDTTLGCTNEGLCKCRNGSTGVDCGTPSPHCHTIIIVIVNPNNVSSATVQSTVAALAQIDVINVEVNGPSTLPNGHGQIIIVICSDDSVNSTSATQNLQEQFASGNDGGLGIVEDESSTGAGSSTGSSTSASVGSSSSMGSTSSASMTSAETTVVSKISSAASVAVSLAVLAIAAFL